MFTKILVPIDGSTFSEMIFPYVRELALNYGAAVHLVRVQGQFGYEPPLGMVLTAIPEPMQVRPADQLEILAEQLRLENITITTEVIEGHVAEGILDCAKRHGADMIAMTTHGRGGINRWLLGSVADKIVHSAPVPVLLVRPDRLT